jgi:hypothetical protein
MKSNIKEFLHRTLVIRMPYKERAKQQQYLRKYRTPYMREYRKRKKSVDEERLRELKRKFPQAYDLLVSKPSRKKSMDSDKNRVL